MFTSLILAKEATGNKEVKIETFLQVQICKSLILCVTI